MQIDVRLGTTFASWTLCEAVAWHDKVRDRLLYEGQHTLVIRTPAHAHFEDELIDQVLEQVAFHVIRETGSECELIRVEASGHGFSYDLAQSLNMIEASPPELAILELLEARYSGRALINTLVLVVSGATLKEEEASKRFVELMQKRGSTLPVLFILYGHELDAAHQEVFDFTRAHPMLDARDTICALHMQDRWSAYLHHRVAWCCDGNLGRLAQCQTALEALVEQDDQALERALNNCARQWSAALEQARWEELRKMVSGHRKRHTSALPALDTLHLRRGDLLQTEGLLSHALAPWVARALLLEIEEGVHVEAHIHDWLRHHLLCLPLQRALLGLCLELEGRLKHLWWTAFEQEGMRESRLTEQRNKYWLYSFPGMPDTFVGVAKDNNSAFVDLGFITSCRAIKDRHRGRSEQLERFRTVRNDLAHNHHVCWARILAIRDCLDHHTS